MSGSVVEQYHERLNAFLGAPQTQYWITTAQKNLLKYSVFAANTFAWFIAVVAKYITQTAPVDLLRDAAVIAVVGHFISPIEDSLIKYGVLGTLKRSLLSAIGYVFNIFLGLPLIRKSVNKQVSGALSKVEIDIIERRRDLPDYHDIPKTAKSTKEIRDILTKFSDLKQSSWEEGKLSGAVYHGGDDLRKLQTEVFGKYTFANQLHPDCFPAVRRMDAEVVSMVLDLFNGPSGSCGTTTSGGTESLLLTCLAARELAKAKRGLTEFEIVAPVTVHAGIDKAAYYFGMKLVHAPINPKTMQVDLKAVRKLIGPNTVLLVGSAPNFPHGIIDDIEGLSKIALANDLPLHVDACLGSFVVPFLESIYENSAIDAPKFDFRVPGVTSISCDTHKYGFAPKGSSVIMYRSPELRKFQYFVNTDWTGGLYASPTLAGSRPGALVASCWATLLSIGRDGYSKSARDIISTATKFKKAILNHPELFFVYGNPIGPVVAIGSHQISVYDLSDALSKRGWHLSALQNPPALHLAVTTLTKKSIDLLIKDIVELGGELLAKGSSAQSTEGTKALYGVAGSVKTAGIADRLAEGFIDCLYKI